MVAKAARNWPGNALDAGKRSQIMFMDRDDILNQFVASSLPFPTGAPPLGARPPGLSGNGTVLNAASRRASA
ncbi:hypothetical protein Scel_10690 [Streptomyces cellostaticus]|nr:hypothetical protein Scel_10690 [Streptomyces cellostaticus]